MAKATTVGANQPGVKVGLGAQRRDAVLLGAVGFLQPRDDLPHIG